MPSLRSILIAAVVALVAISFFSLRACQSQRQQVAQAQQDNRVATAHIQAAERAADTVERRTGEEAELRQVVAQAAEDIAHAEGSSQPVSPAVRSAALRAACKLQSYRDEPACRVLEARP